MLNRFIKHPGIFIYQVIHRVIQKVRAEWLGI